jgi:DnaK suppressor protein
MDLDAVRRELEARRDSTRDRVETLAERPELGAAQGFGKRIGDGTTEAVERFTKVGAAEQLAAMRADVARAVEKLEDGTYGLCDRCGMPIPDERLDARPWSVLCVRCASLR